ncbi:sensor histidine kinase [Calidifontibacillus erzurumensis]|uniref:Signal transduction histidine-protein kinase/phosphatase DegS n=1 Tax=Calidifontibacillus erzurumensis TaxID=2741433 RepID=A0A8J8GG48_9BACI|nr:ATP-binding protein [Calidifontibacillus erzurumensis]NSL51768.1 sensor histidine kinase [Calidifontibacillus erzurumensis]
MVSVEFDEKVLDQILEKMINTVSKSKQEVIEISEQSRQEYENLTIELIQIREDVKATIEKSDRLELYEKLARRRLAEVSKNFTKYSEQEVREAYEKAHQLQIDLTFTRQREKMLIERRNDLEIRLKKLEKTVERADNLVSQITVILNYLMGDLMKMNKWLLDAKGKQEFGLKIIEAQEEERRRLSREIHDGPAQMLANVMMRSELIERISRERGMEEALKEIRDMRMMARSALYEVRKIIYDLRPMALDDLGLIPTLKRYLAATEDYNKVPITFVSIGEEKRLPQRLEIALFRLVQEGVQNAVKHSQATEIQVKVEITKNAGKIIIKDNGIGFDPSEKKEHSFGLIGMKERIELLKGQLHINSAPGKGTTIRINVPIMEDD